jgi:hypothetical protein
MHSFGLRTEVVLGFGAAQNLRTARHLHFLTRVPILFTFSLAALVPRNQLSEMTPCGSE